MLGCLPRPVPRALVQMPASGAVPDDRCRIDEVELRGQEFQDPLVDVGGALHHQEVPDAVDQFGL